MTESRSDSPARAKLRGEVMAVSWSDLVPQFARGALLLLAGSLDLLEVAEAIASDDRARVERWLSEGGLRRASDDDARELSEAGGSTRFQCVIVQPWVLAQVIS
ncbi:MAG: DUF2288 family protein [Myxococcales bacterium]